MTPERFSSLLDAFGGDLDRWPAAEREDARAYLRAHPPAHAALADAARLDALLAAWVVPGPGAALAARVASVAAQRTPAIRRLHLWWSGLGAAAALATGLAAGAIAVELTTPPPQQESGWLYGVSVLGAPLDIDTGGRTHGPA